MKFMGVKAGLLAIACTMLVLGLCAAVTIAISAMPAACLAVLGVAALVTIFAAAYRAAKRLMEDSCR